MADDVILTNIRLDGADQVQDQLRRIGDEGSRAFNRLTEAANQRFDQVTTALANVSRSLDRVANTRVEINTDRANQALENIARVTDQLSRRLDQLSTQRVDVNTSQAVQSLEQVGRAAEQTGRVTSSAFRESASVIDFATRAISKYRTELLALVSIGSVGAFFNGLKNAVKGFAEQGPDSLDARLQASVRGIEDLKKSIQGLGNLTVGFDLENVLKKSSTSIEDLQNVFQLLGESPEKVKTAFSGLAQTLEKDFEKIRKARIDEAQSQQALARQIVQNNFSIIQSEHALAQNQVTADRAQQDSNRARIESSNSVRSAELSLLEAKDRVARSHTERPETEALQLQQRAREFESINRQRAGRGLAPIQDPQVLQRARELLAVRQAEVALSEARIRKSREEADIVEKQQQSALQRESLQLQLANSRQQQVENLQKQAEQAANSIPNLKKFVDDLIAGVSTAGSKVNATAENIAKGLIAGLGPAAQGVRGFGTSLEDLKKSSDIQPALFKIADLFKNTGDEALNARIATELFGTSIDEKLLKALSRGSGFLKSVIDLQKDFDVPNLGKFGDELLKITDSEKRLEAATSVLGKTLGTAFTEALGRSGSGTAAAAQFGGIVEKFKENSKVATDFKDALKALDEELVKIGVSSKQSRFDLGLVLAPFATPIIKQAADGLKGLEINFTKLASQAGEALAPIVKDVFSVLADKSNQVTTAAGEMFAVLVDGFKALGTAAEAGLKAINEFFGSKITFVDIGVGVVLTALVGGFNALALAIGAVFIGTSPKIEEFKKSLKTIGVDVDEIIRKVKVFGQEIPKAIREQFETKDQKTARQEREKQEKAALPPGTQDPDQGIKKLARDFTALGTVIVSTGALLLTFRRTMIAIGVGVGIEKLTGAFSALAPVLASAAAGAVLLSNGMTLLITLLGWPAILVAGLVLVVQNLKLAEGAFGLFVKAFNALFGVDLSKFEVLAGILALIAVRTGLVTFVFGLFTPAVTTAGAAAGAAATGGFAAFLATISRIAIAMGVLVLAVETFQALSNALDKAKVGTRSVQAENEIKDLNIQNRRDTERLRKETDDEKKKLLQDRIDARNLRLKELQAPGTEGGGPGAATKTIEDSQKDLMERLLNGWASTWEKITGVFGKGADAAAKAAAGPLQTPEEIKRIQTDVPSDQSVVRGADGKFFRVPKANIKEDVQIGPVEIGPAQQAVGGATDAQLEAEKAKINDVLKDLAANAAKEIERLLGEAVKRQTTSPELGPDTGKFAGREPSPLAIDTRTLSPQEFRQLQEAQDLVAKFERLKRESDEAATALDKLGKAAGIDDIAGSGKRVDQAVAPAQQALVTTTNDLNTAETTLKSSLDSLTVAANGFATAFSQFLQAVAALAQAIDDLAEAIDALASSADNLVKVLNQLADTTGKLNSAMITATGSVSDLTKVMDALTSAVTNAIDALNRLGRGEGGAQITKASLTTPAPGTPPTTPSVTQPTTPLPPGATDIRITSPGKPDRIIRVPVGEPVPTTAPTTAPTTTRREQEQPAGPGGYTRGPTGILYPPEPTGREQPAGPGGFTRSPSGQLYPPDRPTGGFTSAGPGGYTRSPSGILFPPDPLAGTAAGRRVAREQAEGMRGVERGILDILRRQLEGLKDMPGDRGIYLREQVRQGIKDQQRSMRLDEGVKEMGLPSGPPETKPRRLKPPETKPPELDQIPGVGGIPGKGMLKLGPSGRYIDPSTGKEVPGVVTGTPSVFGAEGGFKPWPIGPSGRHIDPTTGKEVPGAVTGTPSVFGAEGGFKPWQLGPSGRYIDPTTGKEVPGAVTGTPSTGAGRLPPAVPPDPNIPLPGAVVPPRGRPLVPPAQQLIPPQTEPIVRPDGSVLMPDGTILPKPPPAQPAVPTVPKGPEVPGTDQINFDDLKTKLQDLSQSLEALATSAQTTEQAIKPVAPALEQVSNSAQSTTQALEPVTPALEEVSTSAQQVPSEVQQADQAFEQIDFGQAVQEVQQFVQDINQSFQNLSAPSGGEGAATGGLITGPGSETSDSIPILASANEFMMRAAAVRHYGRDFMYRVNSMSFPRLAMGGLVDILNTPLSGQIRLPRFAEGGSIQPSSGGVPVHVNFEGRRVFSANAQRSSIEQLKRESLLQKVRSGGPSPFWVD